MWDEERLFFAVTAKFLIFTKSSYECFLLFFLRMFFLCHIKADHLIGRLMGCVMMGRSGLTNFLNKMARFRKFAFFNKVLFSLEIAKSYIG